MTYDQKKKLKIAALVLLGIGVVTAFAHPTSRAWLIDKWNTCKDTVTGWFTKKA